MIEQARPAQSLASGSWFQVNIWKSGFATQRKNDSAKKDHKKIKKMPRVKFAQKKHLQRDSAAGADTFSKLRKISNPTFRSSFLGGEYPT